MQHFVQRLNDLIRANAHHAIDQMEEPERMLKQYIRELDQSVRDIRLQLARAIAGERRLEQQVDGQRIQIARLAEQACAALAEGDEDLARTALDRKLDLEESAETLEEARRRAAETVSAVRAKLARSQASREQARNTRLTLVARYRAAATLHATEGAAAIQPGSASAPDPSERIADLAERIADFEATAHGLGEIGALDCGHGGRLEQARRKRDIEQQLDSLKAKLKRTQ